MTADRAHLWIEHMRRQLGRPTMTDDEFEALGHQAVDDRYPPAPAEDSARRPETARPAPAEKGPAT